MKSLGIRIALTLALVLGVLIVLSGAWIERQLSQVIYDDEVEQAKIHAQTLQASLQTLMLNGQGLLAREWLNSMHGTAGIVDIEVLRRDGGEAFTDLKTVEKVNRFLDRAQFRREAVAPRHSPFPASESFALALSGQIVVDMQVSGELTVLQPIQTDTACLACHGYDENSLRGVLKLTLSREQVIARLESMRNMLWAIAGLMIVTLVVVVWGALRVTVLGPINKLRDAIVRVGRGERGVNLPLAWRDELGQVATVFKQMQEDLVATETRIRAVTDNVFDAIITADEYGVIESVNPMVEKLFGYSALELLGKNVSMLMPEPYRGEHGTYLAKRRANHSRLSRRAQFTGQRQDGSVFPIDIAISDMYLGSARYLVATIRDITELQQQTEALEYQALHDALTGLPNRTLLTDRTRQNILLARRDNRLLALLIMDLDRFKEINDTLGHRYGDLVLKQVAQRLGEGLREMDTIARLGGDEFAVLLPDTNEGQAQLIARKLIKAMEAPFVVEGQMLHIGTSIGLTLFPQHGSDEVTLMQRADVAMYEAKRHHAGFAMYDPATDQHSLHNLALLGELRGALERDQLRLYFQPKVSIATGKVYGVEALVRWEHPEHGLIYPDDFIPLAEQTGLIAPLTQWVLRQGILQGIRQCQQRPEEYQDIDMAINISVRSLQDTKFPALIARLISEAEGDPRQLRLEITETAIMADPERAMEVLSALSDMGVKLSIDDFGTGYWSLDHLRQMPVDELKIDKSFITNMVNDDSDAFIVRSVIDLAHNMGIKVIAEGVESHESYALLKELGCDAVQGYLICHPLPCDELMVWMEKSHWGWGEVP